MWKRINFNRFYKNDFNKNFLVLLSGSGLAQLIPILSSIILVRFYSPQDFGILALFNAILGIFTPIAALRYEFAIPLPYKVKDSVTLVLTGVVASFLLSFALLIIFIGFKYEILQLFNSEQLGNWLLLVPVSVFLGGVYNCLNYFNIRFKKFSVIAKSNVTRASAASLFQIIFGVFKIGHSGLLIGNVVALLAGNSKMLATFRRFLNKSKFNKQIFKNNIIRYRKFPIVSIWGVLLNNFSLNINNFFISGFFGLKTLGLYSYSYKNLSLPLSIISNNIGQVFYQRCIENVRSGLSCSRIFVSVLKKLIVITAPVFILLFFFIEDLFGFFFGEQWKIAGTYGKYLLPLFFVRSLFSPLSILTMALERQKEMLVMQIIILGSNLIAFWICKHFSMDIRSFLLLYSCTASFIYLINILALYRISFNKS